MTSRKEIGRRHSDLLAESVYAGIETVNMRVACGSDPVIYHNYPKHVVLDLETTGTEAGCGILTIGAVTLDLKHQFYVRVVRGCDGDDGLVDSEATMLWWSKQSTVTYDEAFNSTYRRFDLRDALTGFASFLEECGATALVGNGVSFDNVIIRHAIDKLGIAMPAGFDTRKDFCYRTAKKMLPWIPAPEFHGIPHHALYDALHEARHLNLILNELDLNLILNELADIAAENEE